MPWVLFWLLWVSFSVHSNPTLDAKSVTLNKVTLLGGMLAALAAILAAVGGILLSFGGHFRSPKRYLK